MTTRLETLRTRSVELEQLRQVLEQQIVQAQADEQQAIYEQVQQRPTQKPGAIDSPAGKARRKRAKLISELEITETNLAAVNRVLGEEAEVEAQKTRVAEQKKFSAWDEREIAAWEDAGKKLAELYGSYQRLQGVLAGRAGEPVVKFEYPPVGFDGWVAKLCDAALEQQYRAHYEPGRGTVDGAPLKHLDMQDRLVTLIPDLTLTSERSNSDE